MKIGDKLYDLSVLRKSSEVGRTIKGEVRWYTEPYYQNDFKESTISGTIRSVNCKHIMHGSKNGTCSKCDALKSEKAFIRKVKRSNTTMINKVKTAKAFPYLSKVRNSNLTFRQNLKKLTCYRAMMKEQRLKILNLSKQVARMKVSKQKLL